ncbi:MAG: iron-sulfur cluster assembly scaffold protein [Verrucomicrobiota bacterium]
MNADLEKKIREALANPKNVGEMADADSIGTVGNAGCGEMLRLWVKFKDDKGRRVIDKATFQSFGCETAIAVASMATELIKGKTAEEALALKSEDLSGGLGPLPPMKIHCAELVEGALRSALEPAAKDCQMAMPVAAHVSTGANLIDSLSQEKKSGMKITFLPPASK